MDAYNIELRSARVEVRPRSLRIIVAGYLAALVASETVGAFVDADVGLACHAAVLLVLLGVALTLTQGEPSAERPLDALEIFPALALVPLARILSLTMPVPDLPTIYWYAVTGAPLLLAILLTARLLGAQWTRETFRFGWSRTQGLMAASGLPFGLLSYLALGPDRPEPHLMPSLAIVGILVLPVFTGLTEELLFRGIVQRFLTEVFGEVGLIASAGVFTVMYLGTRSAPYIVLIALLGLLFGWCVRETQSLAGVVVAHGLISIGLVLVWPYVLG